MRLKIFAAALLLGAALLFLVEPMFAKMALPFLGGTAAVWITCMVFFQAGLLAGYAYAHWTTERLGARRQAVLHLIVLLPALVVLPIHIPAHWTPPAGHNPVSWLLVILLISAGLPFFVLSTLTPTLQVWYSNTGNPRSNDPYFLYGASNLGSILGLLIYPTLVEPHLRLVDQSRLWTCAYALLVVLTMACAVILWRSSGHSTAERNPLTAANSNGTSLQELGGNPPPWQSFRWVVLGFVPSSLMLGTTTILTTDFPPIPLFWVVPLTIYLLTFVLVFARHPKLDHDTLIERLPFLILAAIFPTISKTEWPVWLTIVLYLLALFVASMVCHGELARTRPPSARLTEFYLWMSLGGVLGGVFNALVAPLIFKQVLEFPLALVFAAFLRPSANQGNRDARARALDFILPLGLGALVVALLQGVRALGLKPGEVFQFVVFAPTLVICLSFGKRSLRFALGVAALLLSSLLYAGPYGRPLYAGRSFFGVYRVTTDPEHRFHLMIHGSTVHGRQSLDAARRREPLSYYSRSGPIGLVFGAYSGSDILQHVAIVGLGAGSIASYGQRGQEMTFYEIDPVVEHLARDARYFTFLADSPASVRVVLGDARLSLHDAPDRHYGLIVLDAFSSDAIPVHLLTREALQLYLTKLSAGGILVFNISNRYLDLEPVLATLASDAGLACLIGNDSNVPAISEKEGEDPSLWVVMARSPSDLGNLGGQELWARPTAKSGRKVWTDDFSNIVSVIRWWN